MVFRNGGFFEYNPTVELSELSEFGLIERLRRLISQRQPHDLQPERQGRRLLVGIGDDCSVWQQGEIAELATTDTLVQDIHFRLDTTSWRDLGWKALAVNLSDIAAMGGVPSYALVTLGLPDGPLVEGILELYEGMLDCAERYGTSVVGGDIVHAPCLFVSITLLGVASGKIPFPNNVLLRSTAAPNDAIAVTGHVGAAAAGLRLLNAARSDVPAALDAHRRPVPRVELGQLALEAGVRCAMDVSDGLIGDLEKLCAASGLSAEVYLDRVPVLDAIRQIFPDDWAKLALAGGEDYELLLVAPAEVLDAVKERSALPVTIIGRMRHGSAPGKVTVRDASGHALGLTQSGWDHLKRA